MKMVKFLLTIILLASILVIFLSLKLRNVKSSDPMALGTSFNFAYARYLGLDANKVLEKIINDWGFKLLRLSAQWDLVEPEKGNYDWRELDWAMDLAAKNNVKVMLAVGRKTPRWPECHIPKWAESEGVVNQVDVENYIRSTIERYRNHPALEIWQVENEPFLKFGNCEKVPEDLLQKEVELVKQLDPNHRTITTDSGELGLWHNSSKVADFFGTTLYRVVWNKYIGYFSYDYILPAFVYKAKLWFNKRDINMAYITELQAEPWIPDTNILETPLEEQFKSLSLERLKKNMMFAEKTGMPRVYLWGAEWWYWLETKGEKGISDYIKNLKKD